MTREDIRWSGYNFGHGDNPAEKVRADVAMALGRFSKEIAEGKMEPPVSIVFSITVNDWAGLAEDWKICVEAVISYKEYEQ